MDVGRVEELVRQLLIEIGEDPNREGLVDTPKRVAKSFAFLTRGYHEKAENVIAGAVFESEANNMIIARDIEVYSMCEHHMLPFYGRCHIGYIARDKVLGVSKLARLVDVYARRLQIQERLTTQIADAIEQQLKPAGLLVVLALLIFWLVNKPMIADFMIAAEGEMKKVSWSSKQEIVVSTFVVIAVVILMAGLLGITDLSFQLFFAWLLG